MSVRITVIKKPVNKYGLRCGKFGTLCTVDGDGTDTDAMQKSTQIPPKIKNRAAIWCRKAGFFLSKKN